MDFYLVFQGKTYEIEQNGGFVWAPQRTRNGRRNAGYSMMTNIRKGDYILSCSKGRILAIGVANTDCYNSDKPEELTDNWDVDGYRVNVDYSCFDTPLDLGGYRSWLADHHIKESAFTVQGNSKEQYMCRLADAHASFLLSEILHMQSDESVIGCLSNAISHFCDGDESFDDQMASESVNEYVENAPADYHPEWPGGCEPQRTITPSNTDRTIPSRDPKISADALAHANYLCEWNNTDRTFLRKNGKPYTEPHHLIPICRYRDYSSSLDRMENIVSLCSHCHNLLHYGRLEDKKPLLERLYYERIDALRRCNIDLTLDRLLSYYK